jgi:hypothetical protein
MMGAAALTDRGSVHIASRTNIIERYREKALMGCLQDRKVGSP